MSLSKSKFSWSACAVGLTAAAVGGWSIVQAMYRRHDRTSLAAATAEDGGDEGQTWDPPASEEAAQERWKLMERHLVPDMLGGLERARLRLFPVMQQRPLRVYFGTAPTLSPSIGYLLPLSKLRDFLLAGCEVTVLIADLHARLDANKTQQELLQPRSIYYVHLLAAVLKRMGAPVGRLQFVFGWEHVQRNPAYWFEFTRLCEQVTPAAAKKAGSQVVKQERDPKLSGLIYPLMQVLDAVFLEADVELGGIDQLKIAALSEEKLPAIGHTPPVHLFNAMLPSLAKPLTDKDGKVIEAPVGSDAAMANKMSSSSSSSKIDLLDSDDVIKSKINKAFCEEGNVTHNGVLALWEVLVQIGAASALDDTDHHVSLHGVDDVRVAFAQKQLHPTILKQAVIAHLSAYLAPVRAEFDNEEMQALVARAYPATA